MQKQWEAAIDVVNNNIRKFVRIRFQRTWPNLQKVKEISGEVEQPFSDDASPSFVLKARNNRRIEIFIDELIHATLL